MNTPLPVPGASDWILRRARVAHLGDHAIELDVDALPAIELRGTPGWLTGEPLLDQGVEVSMPNLPTDLPLPGVEARSFRCRVEIVGPTAIRVVVAPTGARVFSEQPTWLGIVTEPTIGSTSGSIVVDDDQVVVQTSECRLTVGLAPFRLEFGDPATPTLRTAERLRQVAGFPMAPPVRFREWGPDTGQQRIVVNLELSADEQILGFGEQFSRVVKNSQQLVLRCEDALGTGTEVGVDVGHVRPSVLSLDVADEALDLYLFGGSDPAKRLAAYTTLTGRGDRPPLWAFGYWMGRCRYHSNHEMLTVADEMRERDIPIDILHVDPDWLVVDRLNADFIWNTDRFGQLDRFVADLADRAIRLSVWEIPYLDPISPRYAEAEAAGFLARATAARSLNCAALQHPTNAPAGSSTSRTPTRSGGGNHCTSRSSTPGSPCSRPTSAKAAPTTSPPWMAPRRTTSTTCTRCATTQRSATPFGTEPVVRRSCGGRSGWAGSHRYPDQWGGDAESTIAGMQATLRGGLSHALSNPGFWSHDIGGFFGAELTPGLYVRWTQFGALSPLMRAHGLRPREPWAFGDDALAIARDWIRLRYSLLPYLWQVAGDVSESGLPMMRPLVLEFPDDPIAPSIDDQFLLGADLLVAPILDDRMRTVRRRVYLPAGRWFDLATDAAFDGPGFITLDVPIDSMPLFVRDGARLPRVDIDPEFHRTDDLLDRGWTLHLYGDAERRKSGVELEGFDGRPVEPVAVIRHGVR